MIIILTLFHIIAMPHSIAGHSFNIIQMNTLKIIRDLKKEEKKIFICLRIQIKLANDTKQQLDNQPKYKKKKKIKYL